MTWGRPTRLAACMAVVALVASCSGDGPRDTTATAEPPGTGACDGTDPTSCLLPWPSDRYTRADPSTPTGRRVDLPAGGMPANTSGVRIDPAEWNRNDGFSPASIPTVVIPNLSPDGSRLPPVTDIGASLRDDSPLVLLDSTTGSRLAAWAELDSHVADPTRTPLRVVPAAGLPEGHRIVVGLRGLRRLDGSEVQPGTAFAEIVARPSEAQRVWLDALDAAGVAASDLDVAWSFTVASTDSLTGRLRHMWEETSTELGDGAPPFRVTSVEQVGAARVVRGSFDMPRYLTGDGGPGTHLANDGDPNGIPARNGTMTDEFLCTVPVSATGTSPAPAVVYGHGLLGDRSEVLDIGLVGAGANVAFCALDFLGMSSADIPTVLSEFNDLTAFRTQPDRMQQGHLGFLLLGRLLRSPEGFATDPAFRGGDGGPVLDPARVSFLGASQGGILGGVPSALTEDWSRVVLAVGGMGYNLLLGRSVDFDRFEAPFAAAYPDQLDRVLAVELMEQLWDRGENASVARHLTTDPLPGVDTPKEVMLLQAFGDHQVANVSTERLARTLGIPRRAPTLAEGRSTDAEPFYGIAPIDTFPHDGSALVVWDFGTPAPPTTNTPPREGDDPHGKLAEVPAALALVVAFIEPDGRVIDVCGGAPCRSDV